MRECEKKSPLKCLNCKQEECDMKKITMILEKLDLLKEVNKAIINSSIDKMETIT